MTVTPAYPGLAYPGQTWPGRPEPRPPLLPPLPPGALVDAAPWLPDSPDVIRESHQQVVRVTATPPDYTGDVPLDIIDGSVTFDERRAPRVNADLTAALTIDPRLLDPRAGARITIEAGYARPDVEDVHVLAELGVRRVSVSRPDNTLPLTATSDEARVVDASPLVAGSVSGDAQDAMRDLISGALHPNPRVTTSVTGPPVTVDPVTDRWETIDDLADRHGWDVYDDGTGSWVIEARPTLGTPVLALTVGEAGTVERDESSWDRDGWANYVTLVYRWRTDDDVDHEVRATALVDDDLSPYRVTGPAGKVAWIQERDVPTTQGDANAAAAAVLTRMMSRSRSHALTSPAAYWLRPGMTVTVTPSGEDPQDHLVARVTFNLTAGTMDVDTRLPEPALITTTTPAAPVETDPPPPPEPDPEPPATQRYRTEWTASTSETYRGNGTARGDTTDLVQGWNRHNGNGSGIALFTGSATGGDETGKTITQALQGAAVNKVEVWLWLDHSWYNAGGTARIGYHNGSSLPGTFSGGDPYIEVRGWRPGSGRWVNISGHGSRAHFKDTSRGITVGPGRGRDLEYYLRFHGHTASRPPRLRITYEK